MAFKKGSRYQAATRFVPVDPAIDPRPPFAGIRARRIDAAPGVLEHTVQAGQRLDLLALDYYNDTQKWWRILDANPQILHAGDLVLDKYEGVTIVIPRAGGIR